jgi:hypothetical protein
MLGVGAVGRYDQLEPNSRNAAAVPIQVVDREPTCAEQGPMHGRQSKPINRPTLRQLSDARNRERREEMQVAIAEGRLTVRQMTPQERKRSDAHRAAGAAARAARAARRGY